MQISLKCFQIWPKSLLIKSSGRDHVLFQFGHLHSANIHPGPLMSKPTLGKSLMEDWKSRLTSMEIAKLWMGADPKAHLPLVGNLQI